MLACIAMRGLMALALLAGTGAAIVSEALAQQKRDNAATLQPATPSHNHESAMQMLSTTPWVKNIPGGLEPEPLPTNPMHDVDGSAERGMTYFNGFNCVGCHGPNGGGAMGPSLSNKDLFKFGAHPAQHYLVISHGAPLGMPAWGDVLPHDAVWDIISYIGKISRQPSDSWGETSNSSLHLPAIEQVPFEFERTADPWSHVQRFSSGRKPTIHQPSAPQNVTDLPN